ncbi:MAG: glycosyltransferase [Planctomycetota bacterium]
MPSTLAWFLFAASALACAVWAWINFGGGYGRSTRYRLPQPVASRQGSDTSAPVNADPQPAGTIAPELRDAQRAQGKLPGVAIISPGRDEAEHLPTVLPELCGQDYPTLDVVFVDDASSDATPTLTAELLRRHDNLLVVRNDEEPPAGWMGKCWAVARGYRALQAQIPNQHSTIEWLCFTDADIHWHPRLLRTAMEYAAEHDADLLGVTPTLRFGSAGEAIVQLQLVLALGLLFPFEKAMDPDTDFALTGGAFILVRRSFYDQIGGHEAVKGEMVEDLKLGSALKAAGAKHRVAMAGDLQWCRMYDGWADMWEGLTKNAYAGLEHRWWRALAVLIGTIVLNVLPPVYAVVGAIWLAVSPGWMPAATLMLSLATVLLHARSLNTTRRLMHLPWWYMWTMLPGNATYAVILLVSVLHYHTKGNTWKGRRYPAAASA